MIVSMYKIFKYIHLNIVLQVTQIFEKNYNEYYYRNVNNVLQFLRKIFLKFINLKFLNTLRFVKLIKWNLFYFFYNIYKIVNNDGRNWDNIKNRKQFVFFFKNKKVIFVDYKKTRFLETLLKIFKLYICFSLIKHITNIEFYYILDYIKTIYYFVNVELEILKTITCLFSFIFFKFFSLSFEFLNYKPYFIFMCNEIFFYVIPLSVILFNKNNKNKNSTNLLKINYLFFFFKNINNLLVNLLLAVSNILNIFIVKTALKKILFLWKPIFKKWSYYGFFKNTNNFF